MKSKQLPRSCCEHGNGFYQVGMNKLGLGPQNLHYLYARTGIKPALEVWYRLSYSHDFVPCGYIPLTQMKEQLPGTKFSTDYEVKTAAKKFL
ncbi:hypothetical protein AVEN_93779-1 [Araneus ventricosus]|uniref:Uncharacterized protein n=1 Tax=Araneus ventricosus TaxID=182803 RepID=A0A4Y2FUV1_ARAVE|nr:hypothetical protein AVEN_93779-1 [Araneus ventricosus]